VAFDHAGDRLVGDLFLPPTASAGRPVPVVVLVTGSGPASRHWEDFGARFTAAGLGAYGYDKPGVGDSTGDWASQTLHDRADEVLAAVTTLSALPGVDARRIALFGGSQGGWVAPLAAARSGAIRAVAFFSGPGVSVADNEAYQIEHRDPAEGFSDDEVASALALFRRILARVRAGDDPADVLAGEEPLLSERFAGLVEITDARELAFFGRIADYDPAPALEALRCPVLAIYGSADRLVAVEASIAALGAAFRRSGHLEHDIVVFPGADHGIRIPDPDTGERRRAPGFFEMVTAWLSRKLLAL
jgi:pimeloyl-ACP methyl ester carboxylesterase